MTPLDEIVNVFLSDNTTLLDNFFYLKTYLKIKKVISYGNKNFDIDNLINELDYLINEQKNDRNNVLSIYEYINKIDKKGFIHYSRLMKSEFILYLRELQSGLIINELYIEEQKARLSNYEYLDSDDKLKFNNVLKTRKSINDKQLILKNDYIGGKSNGR